MNLRHWNVLRHGPGPDVVLAVDFGLGRSAAGFVDLLAHLDTRLTVLEVRPLRDVPMELYLRRLAEDVMGNGVAVRAVLGYCAGGTLALGLAELLSTEFGQRPDVVLFDPELIGADTLHAQFSCSVAVVGADLPADRTDTALRRGAAALGRAQGDAEQVAAELSGEYRSLAEDAFGLLGLPAEMAGELVDRFRDFMDYLVVATRLQHRAWSCRSVLVRTVDQPYTLPVGGRVVRLDPTASGPLGDPAVAAVLHPARRPIDPDPDPADPAPVLASAPVRERVAAGPGRAG